MTAASPCYVNRMRAGSKDDVVDAAQRAGRYKTLECNLRVKEVTTTQGSVAARRFVVVHSPEQERFDRARRDDIIRETDHRLAELGDLTGKVHSKAAYALRSHPTYGRHVRQRKTGKLAITRSKIGTESKLDGRFHASSSDPHLSTEDIALGYKQLREIERVNRDLKWLALLLTRVI